MSSGDAPTPDLEGLERLATALLAAVVALRSAGPGDRSGTLGRRPAGGPCGRTDMTYARPSVDTCAHGHRAAELLAGPFAAVPPPAFWVLWRAGYHTPDAVRAATNGELYGLRNFGARSLRAVRAAFPSDTMQDIADILGRD